MLIGRILLGGYFLYNAYNHLASTNALTQYAQSKKIPVARAAVIFTGLLLLLGGFSILLGWRVSVGVAALVLFFIPVTFQMHAFWLEEGETKMNDQIQFGKNLALLGAVLMLLFIPTPWPMSV